MIKQHRANCPLKVARETLAMLMRVQHAYPNDTPRELRQGGQVQRFLSALCYVLYSDHGDVVKVGGWTLERMDSSAGDYYVVSGSDVDMVRRVQILLGNSTPAAHTSFSLTCC
ncbi:MAG: hypothetical protein PVI21_03610 [Candidatus Woesebacteria bacterium]|jgi:hypothetical protein